VTEKGFFHGITQNLVLVGDIADRVGVMAAGQIVEEGPALDVLQRPSPPPAARFTPAVQSYSPSAASKLRSCEI
jgi:ABC-type dipeptide/oligopeptide/nickel transport system ATPase component